MHWLFIVALCIAAAFVFAVSEGLFVQLGLYMQPGARTRGSRLLAWLHKRRDSRQDRWASRAEREAFTPHDFDTFYSEARSRRT